MPICDFSQALFLLLSRGFGAALKSEVFAEPSKGSAHTHSKQEVAVVNNGNRPVDRLLIGFWRNGFLLGSRGVLENAQNHRFWASFFPRGAPQHYLRQQQIADPGTAAVNKRGYSVDRLLVIFPSCLRVRLLLALSARFPLLSAGLLLPSRLRQ